MDTLPKVSRVRWSDAHALETSGRDECDGPVATAAIRDADFAAGAATRDRLTRAEIEVLALAARGKTNAEIAHVRKCRAGTVRIQMSAIFRKLQVRNRAEALLVALRTGLVAGSQVDPNRPPSIELGALLPYLQHRRCSASTVLFRRGDQATELFLVQRGCVHLVEVGGELKEGDHFGEIGLFSPFRIRPSTAICVTDTDLFTLKEYQVRRLYASDAGFALCLLSSITRRLMSDRAFVA